MRFGPLALALAATQLFALTALADKVAVLPFLSTTGAPPAQLEDAKNATRAAVIQRSHTLPSDSEMTTAIMAVADGSPDTSVEYRAAGRASSSQWTAVGHVDPHGATYKLEIDVCQVESGRVESLAREIDPAQAPTQIAEMLALLLRPEGIGNSEIPWENPANKPPVVKPPEVKPPPTPPKPPEPPPIPAVRHAYAENHPIAAGLGFGLFGAVARPDNASGSTLSGQGFVSGEYAFDAVPGLAIRADLGFPIFGPQSVWIDAGARYAIPIVPTIRLFAGPEIDLGAFFPLGGDKQARFLLRGQLFAAIGIGEQVQLELAFDVPSNFGGTGALVLMGGTLRAAVRF